MDAAPVMENIKSFFAKDLKLKLIVGLGLLGMVLILLSQFLGGRSAAPEGPPDNATASFTAVQYIENLESKLSALIGEVDGVGRNQVMVTLESGIEYVYAQEEKRNTDTTREGGAQEAAKVYQKENVEQHYILVDTEYGKKEALVLTELQPKIKGVVIVCEGADDIRVQDKLISVVTTALGISSTRVCVVKIS